MKQTNNAIKFLMAQYRAIFKNAYFKGLTSAVLLTAGLAAGSAQAATVGLTEWQAATDGSYTVASGDNFEIFQDGTISTSNDLVFAAKDTADTEATNRIAALTSDLALTSTGDLVIENNRRLTIGYGNASTSGGDTTVTFANGQVDAGGTLDVWALATSSGGSSGDSSLIFTDTLSTSGLVNITANGSGSATLKAATITADEGAVVTLSASASGNNATLTADAITFSAGAKLALQGASGAAEVTGQRFTLGTDAVMLTTSGDANTVSTENFTIESGAFKVIGDGSNTVSESFAGHQGTINGNVLIQNSGSWTIASVHDEGTELEGTDTKDTNSYHSGSDDIVGDVTFAAGSNVQIDASGSITVKQGSLTIEDGANINALAEGAKITVSNSDSAKGDEKPALVISSTTLKSFLGSGDVYHAITTDSSGNYILADAESKDAKGLVLLTSGGRLELQDATDLSTFSYASGSATPVAGSINVSGSGVIYGDTLSVSKALTKADGDPFVLGSSDTLHVSTNNLTLGDGTTAGLTELNGAGFTKVTVRDSLTLNVADNGYFLFNGGTKTGDFQFTNSDPVNTSTANGNIDFSTTTRVQIKGNWDFNGNWRFSPSGNDLGLIIGGLNTSYDTYVTLDGELINNIDNGGWSQILVKSYTTDNSTEVANDYYSVLDLTKASLSTEAAKQALPGLLTLQAAMNGEIILTGAQLEAILNNDKTGGFALGTSQTGKLSINSSITGEHNFTKFQEQASGQSGSVYYNKVTFSSGGTLDINGDLSLYTGKDAAGNALHSGDALDIGSGTIKADTVYLTNYATKSDKDSTYLDTTFKSGTVEVSEGLVVRNSDKLILGDGTDNANVVLNSESYTLGGGLSVNNLEITSGSALEVKTGVWSTDGDIYANGDDAFVVGYNPTTQAESDFLDAANKQGLQVAQFTGDNFKSNAGGEVIRVNDQAKATFNTMQLADGSVVQLESGHLLVNGATVTKAQDAAKTDTNPAYVNLDNKTYGTSLTAGIDFGNATINVNGAGAVMEFGNLATNALVDLDGDANDTNKDGSKIAITEGGIDEANFHVDNFGQLKFNFDEGTALSTADIDSLLKS